MNSVELNPQDIETFRKKHSNFIEVDARPTNIKTNIDHFNPFIHHLPREYSRTVATQTNEKDINTPNLLSYIVSNQKITQFDPVLLDKSASV